jgi:hypothetical protein
MRGHSRVETQLADGVPQDGLLELHFAAFLGEGRWSQLDCFLVGRLGCWAVVEGAARSAGGLQGSPARLRRTVPRIPYSVHENVSVNRIMLALFSRTLVWLFQSASRSVES